MSGRVLSRRTALKWTAAPLALGALGGTVSCQQTPRVYDLEVSRDAGCVCCHTWADQMEATGRFSVKMFDAPDLPALKRRLGVPTELGACHTALVEGYVIEGHVPAEEILRLLAERPRNIRGIAVPGMPRGSPGMEQPNGAIDAFDVVSFDGDGRQKVFAAYSGDG